MQDGLSKYLNELRGFIAKHRDLSPVEVFGAFGVGERIKKMSKHDREKAMRETLKCMGISLDDLPVIKLYDNMEWECFDEAQWNEVEKRIIQSLQAKGPVQEEEPPQDGGDPSGDDDGPDGTTPAPVPAR